MKKMRWRADFEPAKQDHSAAQAILLRLEIASLKLQQTRTLHWTVLGASALQPP